MGKLMKETILACILIFLVAGYAHCTRPGSEISPDGFPSGEHFNLNIIAKKGDFSCPAVSNDAYGDPVYGNAVFIPEYPEYNVQIVMESGSKGPTSAPGVTELQVTDTCTGFTPNDPAILRLPKNEKGYRVYARVLGKPSKDEGDLRTIGIYDPEFVLVQDELGNDLLYLGLVTDRGFLTTSASFVRTSAKSRATDITGLFQWSGRVCHLTAPDDFTLPDSCCAGPNSDGIFDQCSPMTEGSLCGGTPVYCMEYLNEWVFSIGDFVESLWNVDSNGAKLLQVRFYPL